jgi:hypothetical protein
MATEKLMEPILLNSFGDTMTARTTLLHMPEPTPVRDTWKLAIEGIVGIHDVCSGYVNLKLSSEKCNVLLCRTCFLRIPVPVTVENYGELRDYLKGE